jgi:hypothetical protein
MAPIEVGLDLVHPVGAKVRCILGKPIAKTMKTMNEEAGCLFGERTSRRSTFTRFAAHRTEYRT